MEVCENRCLLGRPFLGLFSREYLLLIPVQICIGWLLFLLFSETFVLVSQKTKSYFFLGLSIVFQLSYIPILSEYHPKVLDLKKLYFEKGEKEEDEIEYELQHEFQSTVIASHGMTIGFLGGMFMAAVGAGLFLFFGSNGLRYTMLAIALWWVAFFVPTMLWVNKRPGPQLPQSTNFFFFAWKNRILSKCF
jgi:hypothetical protein